MVWKIIEKYLEDGRILIFLYSILNEKMERIIIIDFYITSLEVKSDISHSELVN